MTTTPTTPTNPALGSALQDVHALYAHVDTLRVIDDHAERVAAVTLLQSELARLAERVAAVTRDTVVHLRDDQGMTFAAIGARLGFSQQRASQLYSARRGAAPGPVGAVPDAPR